MGVSFHEKVSPNEKTPGAGLHLRLSYTGLYPVFDFALDVGDRDAALHKPYVVTASDSTFVRSDSYGKVYVGGKASVALPLDFSSGGWERKFEPSLSVALSNDDLYGPFIPVKKDPAADIGYSEDECYPGKIGVTSRATAYRTSAVLRGSILRPAASTQMMPSKGFGFEAGVTSIDFNWSEYAQVYGYFPGFHPWHSLKLSAAVRHYRMDMYSTWFRDPCPPAPRGLESNAGVEANLLVVAPLAGRLSLDYAMPILPLDFAIGNLFYIRNFELVPFADLTLLKPAAGISLSGVDLWSFGADVAVNLQRLVLISGDFSIGARLAYSGGSAFPFLQDLVPGLKPFYVGAVFNTNF